MKKFLRMLEVFADTFVLLLILTILGLSIFTVVNLTPGYEAKGSEPAILGVNQQLNINKGLIVTKNLSDESIIRDLKITKKSKDNYLITVTIDRHKNGIYYSSLIRLINNYKTDQKLRLVFVKNDSVNSNPRTSILINNQKYEFGPETVPLMPTLKLDQGKSLDIGLFIESDSNVNFITELEFAVKIPQ